jgi:hypothetical protein
VAKVNLHENSRGGIVQSVVYQPEWAVTDMDAAHRFVWETRTDGVRIIASHAIQPAADDVVLDNGFDMTGWLTALVAPRVRARVHRFVEMEIEGRKPRSESIQTGATHAD